jgi:hypothetical protein
VALPATYGAAATNEQYSLSEYNSLFSRNAVCFFLVFMYAFQGAAMAAGARPGE